MQQETKENKNEYITLSGPAVTPEVSKQETDIGVIGTHETQQLKTVTDALQEQTGINVHPENESAPVTTEPSKWIKIEDHRKAEDAGKWYDFVNRYIEQVRVRVAKNKN